jgi:hypothetical protein
MPQAPAPPRRRGHATFGDRHDVRRVAVIEKVVGKLEGVYCERQSGD